MTRLRAWLTAAAGLVVSGGIALGLALNQAGQGLTPQGTCDEWSARVDQLQQQDTVTAFVAVADTFNPPAAVGDRVLGDCSAGVCTIKPNACDRAYTYNYERSGSVGGWRLFKLDYVPLYIAKGWRDLATANPASVRFYRGYKELAADCLAHFSAAQCRTLATGAGVCWKRAGGFYCRNGRLYGPGVGGVNADGTPATCTPSAGDVPYPCGIDRLGKDPDAVAAADYSDAEP